MVTLADKNLHEIGYVKDANFTADVNGEYEFSVQIARSNWYPELNFSSYIYIVGTEYGGSERDHLAWIFAVQSD